MLLKAKKKFVELFCECFRYIKARESESCIYVKCSLFRTPSCECYDKINKSANLLEIYTFHNHEAGTYNHDAITLSNKIKRRAETSNTNLQEIFSDTCRESGVIYCYLQKIGKYYV